MPDIHSLIEGIVRQRIIYLSQRLHEMLEIVIDESAEIAPQVIAAHACHQKVHQIGDKRKIEIELEVEDFNFGGFSIVICE